MKKIVIIVAIIVCTLSLNKNYELAIQLYKKIISLKDELNTEYYLKISKCYNKLGKNAQAKKYLKVVNLIMEANKELEKQRIPK